MLSAYLVASVSGLVDGAGNYPPCNVGPAEKKGDDTRVVIVVDTRQDCYYCQDSDEERQCTAES